MSATAILAALALQTPAQPAAPAPERPQSAAERRAAWIARDTETMVRASREAGDPARPALKALPSREAELARMLRRAELEKAGETPTLIAPAAPGALADLGCKSLLEVPMGYLARDGRRNGHRMLADCGAYLLDIEEMDYRQPMTGKVTIMMPEAAVNADFGPGKSLARYYVTPEGASVTALSWTDDRQEVRLRATSDPKAGGERWNADLAALMRRLVSDRTAKP